MNPFPTQAEKAKVWRIYISLPMMGQEDTIWERYVELRNHVYEYFDQLEIPIEIVGPLNIEDFDPARNVPDFLKREHPYNWYIGQDISLLLDCDAVWFDKDYRKSKGCQLEYQAACIYEIQRFHEPVQMPQDRNQIRFK